MRKLMLSIFLASLSFSAPAREFGIVGGYSASTLDQGSQRYFYDNATYGFQILGTLGEKTKLVLLGTYSQQNADRYTSGMPTSFEDYLGVLALDFGLGERAFLRLGAIGGALKTKTLSSSFENLDQNYQYGGIIGTGVTFNLTKRMKLYTITQLGFLKVENSLFDRKPLSLLLVLSYRFGR